VASSNVNEPEKDCDGAADREPAGARVVVSSAASNVVVAVHVTSTGTPCVVSGAEAEPALHCVSEGAQPHLFESSAATVRGRCVGDALDCKPDARCHRSTWVRYGGACRASRVGRVVT
jgi:hypothetical protein